MATQINVPGHRRVGRPLPYHGARDEWSGRPGNERFTRVYHIGYAGDTAWRALLPAQDTPLTGAPFMLFQEYQLRQVQEDGRQAELVLTYGQQEVEFDPDDPEVDPEDPQFGFPTLPDDAVTEAEAEIQADIRASIKWRIPNPAWGDRSMQDLWDPMRQEFPAVERDDGTWGNRVNEEPPAPLQGTTKFVVGSLQVFITEFSYGKPSEVLGLVGRRAVPPGYGGSVKDWLITGASRNKQGAFWARSVSYQYRSDVSEGASEAFEWIYPAL